MKTYRIPAVLALIVGFVMAIWGSQLPLNQDNLIEQSTSEWILSKSLTIGGVLIAMATAFGLGRSSKQ